DSRYLAAKMSGENGDVYLSVFISKHGFYGGNWPDGTPAVFQVIVEEKDLNTDLIETDKNFESSEVEIRDFPDNLPAEDISNSRDHPLISRFPGSYIRYYNQENYDEFKLPFQELNTENIDSEYKDEKIWLEGQLTQHLYIAPEDYSPLQIFRNYETAIKEAGFEIIAKNERKVPKGFSRRLYEQINFKDSDETSFEGIDSREENSRYIAAKMSGENGDVYLSVFISKHGFYGGNWPDGTPAVFQLIVEEKEMESDLIDAEKVFRKIESTGKASIQGVYFDYDSAKIKEKSEPTIKEIASLLDNNPDLELYVVGHTDNTGEFEYNMDLSQNRAKALVERLVSKYGIDSKRLEPAGIGPLAPAATNETKEGRSKNRRVELVKSN
ncbi:MAG: OmpA family protein, partial [Bacillota bacterium]